MCHSYKILKKLKFICEVETRASLTGDSRCPEVRITLLPGPSQEAFQFLLSALASAHIAEDVSSRGTKAPPMSPEDDALQPWVSASIILWSGPWASNTIKILFPSKSSSSSTVEMWLAASSPN